MPLVQIWVWSSEESFYIKRQIWFSFVSVLISSLLDYGCTSASCNVTCHKDARCEVQGGTTGCYCSQGYTGNGITFCTGKQVLPIFISAMCLLEKLAQEPISSRIKFDITTLHVLKAKKLYKNFYDLLILSVLYFNTAYHASQLSMTCFPSFFFCERCWYTFPDLASAISPAVQEFWSWELAWLPLYSPHISYTHP